MPSRIHSLAPCLAFLGLWYGFARPDRVEESYPYIQCGGDLNLHHHCLKDSPFFQKMHTGLISEVFVTRQAQPDRWFQNVLTVSHCPRCHQFECCNSRWFKWLVILGCLGPPTRYGSSMSSCAMRCAILGHFLDVRAQAHSASFHQVFVQSQCFSASFPQTTMKQMKHMNLFLRLGSTQDFCTVTVGRFPHYVHAHCMRR